MDRAMMVSLAAVIASVMSLGATTWLSFRYGNAVRSQERSLLDQYRSRESHSAQDVVSAQDRAVTLEKEVSAARERAAALEQEMSTAQGRTAAAEREASALRERLAALEKEAAAARERAVAFEQAARDANERATRATRESAEGSDKPSIAEKAPQFDAAEIQQRLADLGKLVREASARTADPVSGVAAEAPKSVAAAGAPEAAPPNREAADSPVVARLRKYAGTKAAVFVVQPITDAQAAGAAIADYLGEAGWAPGTWTWTGVAGIFGVVVLVREGSDATTNEAAAALVEALRPAGFNITKGDWPANWSRFRGMLDGPQTPGPTDAAIRIVIGSKPR